MLGKEAPVILSNLKMSYGKKNEELISHLHGGVNNWIAIVVVRSYSHMICGDCCLSRLLEWEPDWDPGLDLVLAQ